MPEMMTEMHDVSATEAADRHQGRPAAHLGEDDIRVKERPVRRRRALERIFLSHLHFLLVILWLDFEHTGYIQDFFDYFKYFCGSYLSFAVIDCFDIENTYYIKVLLVILEFFFIGFLAFLVALCYKARGQKKMLELNFVNFGLLAFYVFFPFLAQAGAHMFTCSKEDGEYRLKLNRDIMCWQGKHNFYSVVLGAPIVLCIVLGVPFLMLLVLIYRQKQLNTSLYLSRYGFFYEGLHLTRFYWEVILFFSKALVLVIDAAFVDSFYEGGLTLLLLCGVIELQAMLKPYACKDLHGLQIRSLVGIAAIILSGIIYEGLGRMNLLLTVIACLFNLWFFLQFAVVACRASPQTA